MSGLEPVVALTGVAAVGAGAVAGLLAPRLIARLVDPPPSDTRPPDEPAPPTYAQVAAEPFLGPRIAGWTVLAGAIAVAGVPAGWPWLLWLPLLPVLVALAVVDVRTRLLPAVVVRAATGYALLVLIAEAVAAGEGGDLLRAVLCGVVARSVFWALWWLRSSGLGFGDVRLAAVLGLLLGRLGVAETLAGLYLAFLVLGLPSVVLALVRRDRGYLRRALPFGPALVVGAVLGPVVGRLLG